MQMSKNIYQIDIFPCQTVILVAESKCYDFCNIYIHYIQKEYMLYETGILYFIPKVCIVSVIKVEYPLYTKRNHIKNGDYIKRYKTFLKVMNNKLTYQYHNSTKTNRTWYPSHGMKRL